MGNTYFNNAGNYLIETLFGLYIAVVILRFLFQLLDVDYHNPISRFLVTITAPVLKPIRMIAPSVGAFDLACLVLAVGLSMIKFFILMQSAGHSGSVQGIAILSLADVLSTMLSILFWALFIRVILSWVNPDPRQPAVRLLYQFTEPLMEPARRLIPPIGGLDLSPIALFVLIALTRLLLIAPLSDFAYRML